MSEARQAHSPSAPLRPLSIVAVGNSHLGAIIKGFREFRTANPRLPVRMTFVQLNNAEFRPPLKMGKLTPALIDAIENAEAEALLSCVAGNAHNVLGLLNHPTRFDFVLPQEPDLPLDETAEILPVGLIEGTLRATLQQSAFRVMKALREECSLPMFHLESPPPIPSADFISQIPETKFSDRIGELGVAPVSLRYKLWRLHSALVQRFCQEVMIEYVPVPSEVQDQDGMLLESCWENATHGNGAFGQALLRKTLQEIGQDRFGQKKPLSPIEAGPQL